jgi:hypothetical protein
MLSKETAVVLPLLIASYDWLFCGDEPIPKGRRARYYTALCSTWLILGVQMVAQAGLYHHTGVYGVSPLGYFLTQPQVILHYLQLAFWPTGLCFDLNWSVLKSWSDIVPSLVSLTAFGMSVVYGLLQRRPWAWPGAVFLLALAPSSSFLPLGQIAVEYRMYLALAAVVTGLVLGIHAAIQTWAPPGPRRAASFRGAAGLAGPSSIPTPSRVGNSPAPLAMPQRWRRLSPTGSTRSRSLPMAAGWPPPPGSPPAVDKSKSGRRIRVPW